MMGFTKLHIYIYEQTAIRVTGASVEAYSGYSISTKKDVVNSTRAGGGKPPSLQGSSLLALDKVYYCDCFIFHCIPNASHIMSAQ